MSSQSQSDEDDPPSDDDLNDQVSRSPEVENFDQKATALNISQEDDEIYNSFELDSILNLRHVSGILELLVSYKTDKQSWHPIEMFKNEGPQDVAQYIMSNDLGEDFKWSARSLGESFLMLTQTYN